MTGISTGYVESMGIKKKKTIGPIELHLAAKNKTMVFFMFFMCVAQIGHNKCTTIFIVSDIYPKIFFLKTPKIIC